MRVKGTLRPDMLDKNRSYIGIKRYYWHGFFVIRETVFIRGRKAAEQFCIRTRKTI